MTVLLALSSRATPTAMPDFPLPVGARNNTHFLGELVIALIASSWPGFHEGNGKPRSDGCKIDYLPGTIMSM